MEKYDKVKVLGKGSFGSAVLVRRRTDRQLFVAKEIQIAAMTPQEREEARQEFRVLQQVNHPNIIRYHEHIETKQRLYIIMEYADGGDLYTKIKNTKGRIPEETIMRYFCQICLAVQHLHEQYILHRDIKTMNIFLTSNGVVKLGDFGVATVLRNTMALARTVCGTPYYFSPELCRNAPYNNKSDIWAVGCVLYELCTLRNAFDGVNMKALVAKILKGVYPPIPAPYTPELRSLVGQLLQRAPLQRPGINTILATPIVRKALDSFEAQIAQMTRGQKIPTPPPMPPPVVAIPAPMVMGGRQMVPGPVQIKGNILKAPQERVKAWQEEREKERLAKKEADNRKRMDQIKTNLDDGEQVRAQGWLAHRNEKKKQEIAQRDEDQKAIQDLDNMLRRAMDNHNLAHDRAHAELRQWHLAGMQPQPLALAELDKAAWDNVPIQPHLRRRNDPMRRSASVNSPSKGMPPGKSGGGGEEEVVGPPQVAVPPPPPVVPPPRHGRRSHSIGGSSGQMSGELQADSDFIATGSGGGRGGGGESPTLEGLHNIVPTSSAPHSPREVQEFISLQKHIREIVSRPAGQFIDIEFGDEATIEPDDDTDAQNNNLEGSCSSDDDDEDIAVVDVSSRSASTRRRREVDSLVKSLFPSGGGGSVHNRAEVVRHHLDALLGTDTFLRAYRVMEHIGPDSGDDDLVKVVQGILGPQHAYLVPLLTQLIVCDEEANTQS